jgi:hypothetical protein
MKQGDGGYEQRKKAAAIKKLIVSIHCLFM